MAYASRTQMRQARSAGGEQSEVSSPGVTLMKKNAGADTSKKGFYGKPISSGKPNKMVNPTKLSGTPRKMSGKVT